MAECIVCNDVRYRDQETSEVFRFHLPNPPPKLSLDTEYNINKQRLESMLSLNYNDKRIAIAAYYPVEESLSEDILIGFFKAMIRYLEERKKDD